MKIISKFDDSKYSEFLQTLFKDNLDTVNISEVIENGKINIRADEYEFSLPIYFDVKKQSLAMHKTVLLKKYNIQKPYGGLVGVRPIKLVRSLIEEYGENKAKIILKEVYLVSDNKIDLFFNIYKNSKKYIFENEASLYIGIAFCPTKCSYCSFPAYLKKGKYEKNYDKYIETLIEETKIVLSIIKDLKINISSIYIGGGTPSYLSENELELLLKLLYTNLYFEKIKEFTFEAGRIDTINKEKLELMKKYKVSRLSINPQSFNEKTLKYVNRYHDMKTLNNVYDMAKDLGFDINMDYIISLPKESTEDIINTIEKFNLYSPSNITIHNLAIKRTSYLGKSDHKFQSLDYKLISEKIWEYMNKNDYIPYYMYRQKNSSDYMENIGFCKENKQSIYNIDMIEEKNNVISIGAGSITKLISKDIKRVIMPKDPLSYILEFENRIKEKERVIREFYEKA